MTDCASCGCIPSAHGPTGQCYTCVDCKGYEAMTSAETHWLCPTCGRNESRHILLCRGCGTPRPEAMASAETGEQWRKRGVHSLLGSEPRAWLQIGDEPEHESEIVGPEWLIDRIIADHRAAAAAGLLLAALREARKMQALAMEVGTYKRELQPDHITYMARVREEIDAAITAAEAAGL